MGSSKYQKWMGKNSCCPIATWVNIGIKIRWQTLFTASNTTCMYWERMFYSMMHSTH